MVFKNYRIKILFFLILVFLLSTNFVLALEINYPRVPGAIPPQDFVNSTPQEKILALYIDYFFNLSLWIGGILALGTIVYGGIKYLLSTGNPEGFINAKRALTNALVGLLILFSVALILNTINPNFANIKIEKLKDLKEIKPPAAQPPELETASTSIDVEIPLGRIIDSIVGREYNNDRTKRIQDAVNNIDTASQNLSEQSNELEGLIQPCSCQLYTFPDPRCTHPGCFLCPPPESTGDPCEPTRSNIQDVLESENPKEINNLNAEQVKLEEEVRLLREQINRLTRAKTLINGCPGNALTSRNNFLLKKDTFSEKENWHLRELKYWSDIDIDYYEKIPGGAGIISRTDDVTFYCQIGGTIDAPNPFPGINISADIKEDITEEEMKALIGDEYIHCTKEVKVGSIVDRTERSAELLNQKIEKLINQTDNLISLVDDLQVLVSKCSSKNCFPKCVCAMCGTVPCCIEPFPSSFPKDPNEGPCPKTKIEEKKKEINEAYKNIKKTKEEIENNINLLHNIGAYLNNNIRLLMSNEGYYSTDWLTQDKIMISAKDSKETAKDRNGNVIRKVCQIYDEKGRQTDYGDCFEQCADQLKHDQCINNCTNKNPKLSDCYNELSFYYCETKK